MQALLEYLSSCSWVQNSADIFEMIQDVYILIQWNDMECSDNVVEYNGM